MIGRRDMPIPTDKQADQRIDIVGGVDTHKDMHMAAVITTLLCAIAWPLPLRSWTDGCCVNAALEIAPDGCV